MLGAADVKRLRALWTYRQRSAVARFFARWYAWAIRSRLEPVKRVARTIKRHLDGVLRYVQHPIANGVAEGLPLRGLDLYPR